MLHDDDRVPPFDQGVECRQQLVDVVEMQPRRRLVEDEHHAALGAVLGQERCQLHALALAARKGRRRLPELDVTQPHVLQRFEPFDDAFAGRVLSVLAEKRDGVIDGHLQHVVDRLAAVFHFEYLVAETLAAAGLAHQFDVGHELHRDLDDPLALALFAAASRDVEREGRRPQSRMLGVGLVGEQLADLVIGLDIGHGVRPR